MNTPELDKLEHVKAESQQIGEFLEWLGATKHYWIARWNEIERLEPVPHGSHGLTEELLAEYFEIDLTKIEVEKESIFQELRSQTGGKRVVG